VTSSNPEVSVALAEAQLSDLKTSLEEIQAQRDSWEAQTQRLVERAVADLTEAKEAVARLERAVTALRHQPLWKRLAG
jgi:polyhydroxyalkanoate synthesis regulator phasin